MSSGTTKDGVEIFDKDWGPQSAQPVMFHHGMLTLNHDVVNADLLAFIRG